MRNLLPLRLFLPAATLLIVSIASVAGEITENKNVFPNAAKTNFKVGDRVEGDPTMLGKYIPGVIAEVITPGWAYKILFDGYSTPESCHPDHIRPALPAPPSSGTLRTAGGVPPRPQTPATTGIRPGVPAASTPRGATAGGQNPAARPATPGPGTPAGVPAGKGTPPNGIYNCEKISGSSYIGLGKIEIRGNTYRGIDEEGKGTFRPFSVDGAGNITWSAGLTGMPDGWKLKTSRYAGPDNMGRPLIQIYYTSKAGWNDMIDCVREKP